ncbi:MAG: hypothetical protein J6C23_01710 [Clostridia bacterium]|nr:hypothetical protein [Clostridia bacterium]
MKEVFLILPLLFKSGFRKRTGEKGNPIVPQILMGAILLFYSISGGIELIPSYSKFYSEGLLGGFITTILILSVLVSTLFSIAPMISLLYFSKDGEFYLHLPLRPSSVYFAKLIYLYVSQLYMSALVSAPLMVIIGITLNMSVVYYLILVIAVLVAPFMGLVITSVVALPIVAIASLVKNRGAVSNIALIVTFAIVILAYMYIAVSGGSMTSAETVEMFTPTIKTVSAIAVPFLALANASLCSCATVFGSVNNVFGAVCINLSVAIVFFVLLAVVASLIGKSLYAKGVSALLENRKVTQKGDNVLKKTKQFSAFLSYEIKSIMRNSALAFSCAGVLSVCPAISIVISLTMGGEFLGYITYGMVYVTVVGIGASINISASIAFSKDGENFYMFKYLPIDKKKVIGAKLLFCSCIITLTIIVSLVIAMIIIGVEWYHWFSLLPVPLLYVGVAAMDMLLDLRRPKLYWSSISEVTKNSSHTVITGIVGMGIMFVILIPSVFLLVILGEIGYLYTYLLVALIGVVFTSVFLPILFNKGVGMIDRVE